MRCSSVLCSLALTFGIVAPVAVTAQGGSGAGIVVGRGPARAAGVVIQRATGAVGSGSRIRIRGASSFSLSTQPLMYVDGVRVDADPATGPANQAFGSASISRYNDFNPDDIESIEVLKGPAATTRYG